MLDAVKAFLFVPISVTAILSAMQLYLALVLLDVGLVIVTCMNLYFLADEKWMPAAHFGKRGPATTETPVA